jgi:hypothetical protein
VNAQPDKVREVVASIHEKGVPLHSAFKTAFPAMVPDGAVTAGSVTPAAPVILTVPAAAKPRVTEMSPAQSPSTSALELKPTKPAKPPLPPSNATTSKPVLVSRKENEKEKTMTDPNVDTNKPPVEAVPVKRRGGLPKGYKFNKSAGPKDTKAVAGKSPTSKSRNTGMIFFVETEPKSGLYKIEPLREIGDVLLILDQSDRRVFGAVSAREF